MVLEILLFKCVAVVPWKNVSLLFEILVQALLDVFQS